MTFLTLNGTTVRCRKDACDVKDVWHRQDIARAFDGQIRQSRGPLFREFSIQTALETEADYLALRAILNSDALPLLADGDLIGDGPINAVPKDVSWTPVQSASGFRRQAKFTLWEDVPTFNILTGLVFDYDADDAVTVPTHETPYGGGGFDFDGITGIPNAVAGPSLNHVGGQVHSGWYDNNSEIANHSLARAWGNANNTPMVATLSSPITGLPGITIMCVCRAGHNTIAMGFMVHDSSGFGGSGVVLWLGVAGGLNELGGWRRGGALGETGEVTSGINGGTIISSSVDFSGESPANINDATAGEGDAPGGPFDVMAVRITTAGIVSFFKNGAICPLTFTAPAGPFEISELVVTSQQLGAFESFDWTRLLVYQKALTSDEIRQASETLGGIYGIATE